MPRLSSPIFVRVATCLCLSSSLGCWSLDGFDEWAYVLSAAGGEINLLSRVVPIESGLNDPALNDEQRDKLGFIIRARDYARDVIGLNVGGSYQSFANLGGESLAWNLTASRKDAIEPYVWQLPLVGPFTYLGFFQYEQAVFERDRLVGLGYDTLIYEVDAFSTLGLLPDPVASPLLRRPYPSLADTVMHELTHNTTWHSADTTFNESLATFVGKTAGLEFLRHEWGADSAELADAVMAYEDKDRFDAFLAEVMIELEAYYAGDLSSEEKIGGRGEIFDAHRQRFVDEVLPLMHHPENYESVKTLPLNNAYLIVNGRYNTSLDLFARVYELNNEDWSSTLGVFSEAGNSADPIAYLQSYADQATAGSQPAE